MEFGKGPLHLHAQPDEGLSADGPYTMDHGHWQYRVLPFGLHGALATFQKPMDIIRNHRPYAAAYLDDVVIHSKSWEDHLHYLILILGEMWKAGLTVNT